MVALFGCLPPSSDYRFSISQYAPRDYEVEKGMYTQSGEHILPGYYVPIDYQVVGGRSNVAKRGRLIEGFYTPDRIYFKDM